MVALGSRANLPDQAVLLDFAHGRLFLFFIEIWPQELYYITGLLVISALGLFLVTALAGRVWCGYACPQTVWTDLMIAVERFWQGDRNARIRLDKEPWTASKIFKKVMTHLSWLVIGLATGGALVFYFRDARRWRRSLLPARRQRLRICFSVFSRSRPIYSAASRVSRSAFTCAHGRAFKAPW